MRKLITILGFLMIGFVAKAQFPFTQTVSNASTLYKIRGGTGFDSTAIFTVAYADTTAANLGYIDNIAGAVIRTANNKLWLRNGDVNTWVEIGSGGGGSGTVTSISQGYGITNTPNPITTTGTIIVDSATLSSYYLRRKDSVDLTGYATQYDLSQLAQFNLTAPVDGQYIVYYNGQFINTDKNRNISWTVGDVGYPTAGQNTYTNSALINRNVQVFREGDQMFLGNTTTGFTFVSGTGTITFYPNLSPSEKIIIIASSTLVWY